VAMGRYQYRRSKAHSVLGKQYLATSTSTASHSVDPVKSIVIGWGVGGGLVLRLNGPEDKG